MTLYSLIISQLNNSICDVTDVKSTKCSLPFAMRLMHVSIIQYLDVATLGNVISADGMAVKTGFVSFERSSVLLPPFGQSSP